MTSRRSCLGLAGAGLITPTVAKAGFIVNHLSGFGGQADVGFPSVTDLTARYRADLGVTKDGSNLVSAWADQSGNGYTLSEGTNPPLWVSGAVKGRPSIRFDGTNDRLVSSAITLSQPFHIFIVVKQVSWTSSDHVIGGSGGANIQQASSSPIIQQSAGVSTTNTLSLTLGTFFLASSFFNGASSYQARNDDAAVSGGNPGAQALNTLHVGAKSDNTSFSNVEHAEICVFSAEKTGAELSALKNYFNYRYGLW